ncbi:MAG: PAS domain S-box-containing protein [Planctomycetota bacterium]|jgi:PAS domain S-box-containing protein
MNLVSPDELLILLWMYPETESSADRFELLERIFVESGKAGPKHLKELFLGELRNNREALATLIEDHELDDLLVPLALDRCALLALREEDEEARLHFEELLEEKTEQNSREFFTVRSHQRLFQSQLSKGLIAQASTSLSTVSLLVQESLGYDLLECQEAIMRVDLKAAEGDPEALTAYLALRRDSRLFDHDRAEITMSAARVLSKRQQFASSLALWLELLQEENSTLPPRRQQRAVLLFVTDLMHAGEFDAVISELKKAKKRISESGFLAYANRLESIAQVRVGNYSRAQQLISTFPEEVASIDQSEPSLAAFAQVCLLRATGQSPEALEIAASTITIALKSEGTDSWLPHLARERVRILRESHPGDPAIVKAAQVAIQTAAVAQDSACMRDVYFTLAMHHADQPETSDKAIEACRDAERCARTIMETLAADRDILFQLMPTDSRSKTVVSALLGRLSENARRGLKNLFELIRSLVRQSQSATELLDALRQSQRRIARILETLPIVFWTSFGAARDFALFRADGAVEDLFGQSFDEISASSASWLGLIHPNDRSRIIETLKEVEATLGGKTIAFRREDLTDGSTKWIELQIRSVIGEAHDDGVLYGIMSDVTERHNLQESIARNQKMKLLGHVVGNITHEFNNVIGAILGAASLLDQLGDRSSTDSELIHAIEMSAIRGRDLTANLAILTTQEAAIPGRIDLIQAVEDAAELARSMVAPEINIEIHTSEDELPISLSRESITRCMLDLIRNAEESNPSDQTVTIRLRRIADHAVVSVEDRGVGMPPEVVKKANDPFFTTKNKSQHQGLGLTMVDKIARDASAKFSIRSKLDEGTVATIAIPLHVGPIDENRHEEGREFLMSRGGRLLVIDDDPQILQISRGILEGAGFEVVTANDGVQGLAEYDTAPSSWSLVISDIRMPRLDGIGLILKLRKRSPLLPILLMTGYSDDTSHPITDDDPNADVIHKPFTARIFLERAASLLAGTK